MMWNDEVCRGPDLGVLELGWGPGGFAGSWGGGSWYDRWGSYHDIFALAIGVAFRSCVTRWLAAPCRLKRDGPALPDKH